MDIYPLLVVSSALNLTFKQFKIHLKLNCVMSPLLKLIPHAYLNLSCSVVCAFAAVLDQYHFLLINTAVFELLIY